jgi:hypothetical protein
MNKKLVSMCCCRAISRLFIALLLLTVAACGSFVSSAKKEFARDLSETILSYDDPETIRQAVPAYLILVSSMIKGDKDNVDLLVSGSRLYGAYTSAFVDEKDRKIALAKKSFEYAGRAVCLKMKEVCGARTMPYNEYEQILKKITKDDASVLFSYGAAWAGLVQANRSNWNAVAELPKVKATINRVLELDETISNGDAHLYMGVMESLLPPTMGGKTEQAKKHFERALELSGRTNLMAMLLYAEKYARLIFDRELHDKLLNELIGADISKSDMALIDVIAKTKAKKLLAGADDYF